MLYATLQYLHPPALRDNEAEGKLNINVLVQSITMIFNVFFFLQYRIFSFEIKNMLEIVYKIRYLVNDGKWFCA